MNADKAYIIDDVVANKNLNLKFSFKKDKLDVLRNLYILGNVRENNGFNEGYHIRGYRPEILLKFLKLNEIKKKRIEEVYDPEYIKEIDKTNVELMKELKCSDKEFEKFLKDRFAPSIQSLDYTVKGLRRIPNEQKSKLRKDLSDEIYKELVETRNINFKINEAEMYRIIKMFFPEAKYRYKADFLGEQTLDVYVPSKKIGFEYQGLQYFNAIEISNNKEAFDKKIERDIQKKKICCKNGIDLIEWNYYEKINLEVLREKLGNRYNITIDNSLGKVEKDYLETQLYNLPHINIYDDIFKS